MSASPTSSMVRSTLLAAADRRPSINLNGAWRTIVDPYATGLHTFHGKLRTDGYFMNGKQAPGGEPVEYDFQKSSFLQVPGDWNANVNRCSITKVRSGTKRTLHTNRSQERGCFFM